MSEIIAYLRVSKRDEQDTRNQKLAILEYAQKENVHIDRWLEISVSSRKSMQARRIDELMETLQSGDTLICAEISRLGRSVGQIAQIVDSLVKNQVNLITLKEGIRLTGKPDISTKMKISMFSLFAEIERDLISERTKEGLRAARAKGKLLGRPKGKGKSKLDAHKQEIQDLLKLGLSKTKIAEKFGVHISTLDNFLKKTKIQ